MFGSIFCIDANIHFLRFAIQRKPPAELFNLYRRENPFKNKFNRDSIYLKTWKLNDVFCFLFLAHMQIDWHANHKWSTQNRKKFYQLKKKEKSWIWTHWKSLLFPLPFIQISSICFSFTVNLWKIIIFSYFIEFYCSSFWHLRLKARGNFFFSNRTYY